MKLLMKWGPARGYFPNPTKSILVVKPQIVEQAEAKFAHLGFTVVTGTQYLGGHVGTNNNTKEWVSEKVTKQTTFVTGLSRITRKHLHCTFCMLNQVAPVGVAPSAARAWRNG